MNSVDNMAYKYEREIPEGYEARIEGNKVIIEKKESEDERMKKAIVHILYENYSDAAVIEGVEIAEIVAWLEKQREQKPAECIPDSVKFEEGFKTGRELGFREGVESVKPAEWSDEDENFIKELCNLLASIAKNNYVGRYYAPELVSKLQSLRPQPKQEWGEEDEDNLDSVIDLLYILDSYIGDDCSISQEQTEETRNKIQKVLRHWLKSLPERFPIQPKQEWSGEDREMLYKVISRVGQLDHYWNRPTDEKMISWLKSLLERFPIQSKQEWSEEDGKMLTTTVEMLKMEQACYESTGRCIDSRVQKCIDWLKSIRNKLM